ncbi:effector binding domain-containing protein [Desulfosporosinus sp.]|uniref:GyrI-like domain-containing protein n=1 Tax=Desulfosporosinus sp. TaxID=157907 RepID=UPI00231783FA|nr:effector binding domain-containing protein [Desulfosporosinus sp.]MCO5384775.1 effector binding domain-containing protein [Desulfosporosinus sp.]MDA8220164.1 effector binding domain-containing protein [Desulfitobacterium hafniense]
MDYEVVLVDEKTVVGLMVTTTNEENRAMTDIGMLWGEFLQAGVYYSISNKINPKGIGLYTDYEGDFTKPYRFLACCEVSEATDLATKMVVKMIPRGNYAKFIVKGHMQHAVAEF